MDEETLQSDANLYDLADDGVLLTAVREEYERRLGQPPGDRFPTDVLVVYIDETLEPRVTVAELAQRVVDRCADRLAKYADAMAGVEGKAPKPDDPVGRDMWKSHVDTMRAARKERTELARAALDAKKDEAARARAEKRIQMRMETDAKAIEALRGGGR